MCVPIGGESMKDVYVSGDEEPGGRHLEVTGTDFYRAIEGLPHLQTTTAVNLAWAVRRMRGRARELREGGATPEEVVAALETEAQAIHDEINQQVQDAAAYADSSPMPEPSTLLEDVYA